MNKIPYINNMVMSSSHNFQPITQNILHEHNNTHSNNHNSNTNVNHLHHYNHHQRHNHHRDNHNQSTDNYLNANHLMSNELNKFFSNNNHIDTRMHATNHMKSPMGRKSVSPHFFYANKTTTSSNHNNTNSSFIPFGSNMHTNFSISNHSNANIPHLTASLNHHSTFHHPNQPQQHNEHPRNLHTTSNYSHANSYLTSFNLHESANLKLPTTPTRSKSLSPSLRDVIQHPRLRHKQQNKTSHTETEFSNRNGNHHNQNHSVNMSEYSISNTDLNKQEKKLQTKDKSKSTVKASSFELIDKSKTDKREKEEDVKKLVPLTGPINKPTLKRQEHSSFESMDTKPSPSSNCSSNKILNKNNDANVKTSYGQIENEKAATASESNNKTNIEEEIFKTNTIKLPINVRSVNLNNFPPNQGPNSKRLYSLSLKKLKSSLNLPLDKSMGILKQNIQYLLNEKLKEILDECKKDFVDPAIRNISNHNSEANVSDQDMAFFFDSLVDEAKNYYIKELKKINGEQDVECRSSSESGDLADEDSEKLSSKRKSPMSNQSSDDVVTSDKNNSKKLRADLQSTMKSQHKKLNKETKFVLGKTVNEIFLRHPHLNQTSSDPTNKIVNTNSNSFLNENVDEVDFNENNTNYKSIYAKYPNLFRYEADQSDRQWLNENHIIKRKNFKCYLLLFDEIEQLFLNTNNQESANDEISFELISQQLKTFTLPESILFKINKSYLFKKSI